MPMVLVSRAKEHTVGGFTRTARTVGVVLAAVLVLAVTSGCAALGLGTITRPGLRPGVDVPSGAGTVAAAPLGVPPLPPAGLGGYAFSMTHRDGSPVAFDPCRPIHYVVRPDGQPQGGRELLTSSFAQVSAATGLQFVDDGDTSEAPLETRAPYQRGRYGDRWAPVLVVWSSAAETAMLADGVLGRAGPDSFGTGDDASVRLVSGLAVFNGAALGQQLASGDDSKAQAVLLHELGHLVGLAHVPDPYQVMFDTNAYPLSTYRAGDLRGLEQLGRGPCFRDY
jgi:hypothetical protein